MGCIQLFVELGIDPNLKTKQGDTALNLLCKSSIGRGQLDCARFLVEKLALHPNIKNEDGENALHCLYQYGSFERKSVMEFTRYLIDHGADVNAKTNVAGNTPLHCFLLKCISFVKTSKRMVKFASPVIGVFIEKDMMDIHAQNANGDNVLHLVTQLVICADHVKTPLFCFSLLFKAGMDINSKRSSTDESVLHIVCREYRPSEVDLIKFFFRKSIDILAKDNNGRTALHLLIDRPKMNISEANDSRLECIRLLVNRKTKVVNRKTKDGDSVLHLLCRGEYVDLDLLRILIKNRIDLQAKDYQGDNALHLVCRHSTDFDNRNSCFALLVDSGVDVNAKATNGDTVLHLLCREKEPSISLVRFFIQKGIDINAINNGGKTALHLLCHYCESEDLSNLIRLLVEAGVNVEATSTIGSSALTILCGRKEEIENFSEIIQFLNCSQ